MPDSTVTAYTFDDSSNRINMTKGSETTSYEYDANNRLLKETNILGDVTTVTSYKYDNNGNQLAKAKEKTGPQSGQGERYNTAVLGVDDQKYYETYEYDGLNRLVTAKLRDNTVNYTYNPNNLRKTKEVNGVVTRHIWNGQNIIAKADGNNNITVSYIRGINLIKTKEGTASTYHIYNGHGDVIQLTDTGGNVTKNYNYDAFGNEENIDPNDNNPFRYCGGMYYFDKETGDYYLKARYYNPQIGRFITEDPVKDGLNWYTYAGNNPIMFIDPTGFARYAAIDYLRGIGAGLDDALFGGNIRKLRNKIMVATENGNKVVTDEDVQNNVNSNQEYSDGYNTVKVWEASVAVASMGTSTVTGGTAPAVVTNNGQVVSSGSAAEVVVAPNIVYSENEDIDKNNNFPKDPTSFKPKGLVKKEYNNGKIIKWHDPKTGKAIYEWNTDAKYGNHYHYTPNGKNRMPHPDTGDTHIKPGSSIPKLR